MAQKSKADLSALVAACPLTRSVVGHEKLVEQDYPE